MPKITKIEPKVKALPARKKVAAYARVSMETERQHHSLSAQISYYSELIQKNPEWEYAGVYADEGISGTSVAKRPEFQRMLDDCEAGKIDIILTKSISRFARNTVDLLKTVRHLKDLGIEVQFEKEHINSLSGDGEVMLTLLASFAQSESESISTNVKWGIRKRMQSGIPYANGHMNVYGYRWEGDEMVIVPEEATIVKRIYQNFLDGKSRQETEKEFAAEGIKTRQDNKWTDSNLKVILTNITYTGNMLYQKEYVVDPISKKTRKKQTMTMADGHQNAYWHCADKKNHPGKSLREDHLKEIINEVLGLDEFDEKMFLEKIDHISVRNLTHLTFHFKDGRTAEREYEFRKEGVKWTDERREKQTEAIRDSFTPERRQNISENMKKIRSEKFWNSKRK